ncbi:MAG: DUF4476 domain-containing protein [Thermaurantimonas sp.]
MRKLRYGQLLMVSIPLVSLGQQLVITSAGSHEFTFGIDSVVYTLSWQTAVSTPIHKDQNTFFVLLRGDSTLIQKKLPKSTDVHHYVIDRSNTGKITLFYRGILAGVPDSVTVVNEKTRIRLSDFLKSKEPVKESPIAVHVPAVIPPLPPAGDTSEIPPLQTERPLNPAPNPEDTAGNQNTSYNESISSSFEQVVQKVSNAEFEFEKMMAIKDYFEKNQTTTQELLILARLLTYDLTRLQLLKEAYEYTTDRINYSTLISVFDFDLSKQSFLQYLSENEK